MARNMLSWLGQRWLLGSLVAALGSLSETAAAAEKSDFSPGEIGTAMTEDEAVQRQRWLARGMTMLLVLTTDDDFDTWREEHGTSFESQVHDGIAALLVHYERERTGPFASDERRQRVLEQIVRMRDLLAAGGVTDELRRVARSVVEELDPRSTRWFEEHPDQTKYGREG